MESRKLNSAIHPEIDLLILNLISTMEDEKSPNPEKNQRCLEIINRINLTIEELNERFSLRTNPDISQIKVFNVALKVSNITQVSLLGLAASQTLGPVVTTLVSCKAKLSFGRRISTDGKFYTYETPLFIAINAIKKKEAPSASHIAASLDTMRRLLEAENENKKKTYVINNDILKCVLQCPLAFRKPALQLLIEFRADLSNSLRVGISILHKKEDYKGEDDTSSIIKTLLDAKAPLYSDPVKGCPWGDLSWYAFTYKCHNESDAKKAEQLVPFLKAAAMMLEADTEKTAQIYYPQLVNCLFQPSDQRNPHVWMSMSLISQHYQEISYSSGLHAEAKKTISPYHAQLVKLNGLFAERSMRTIQNALMPYGLFMVLVRMVIEYDGYPLERYPMFLKHDQLQIAIEEEERSPVAISKRRKLF